ncbi:T9SS type A sorting domain-containing protein [Rubrivirga sp.]|uniref:T9SS type A sorting domain-containing protein n=1 Tax=Rubrivirga sp. TaxID=1885344 RepID=UPI003B51F729
MGSRCGGPACPACPRPPPTASPRRPTTATGSGSTASWWSRSRTGAASARRPAPCPSRPAKCRSGWTPARPRPRSCGAAPASRARRSGRSSWSPRSARQRRTEGRRARRRAAPPRPNPAGRAVDVSFTVATAGEVVVELFDALGRRVLQVVDGPLAAGTHSARADVSELPTGIYALRLTAGGDTRTHLLTVVR